MSDGRRETTSAAPLRARFVDEWVGLVVLAAFALLAAAAFEAGVLQQWLHPGVRLVLLLPQTGTDGLSLGADVEVLGIHAGTVRRIRLNPDGEMYAVADIDQEAEPFLRRDSRAVIRRRFAVAGATYVDLSRGHGTKLDWHFAVLQATTEPDPIATITRTIDEIRAEILPTLAGARATVASLQAVASGLQQGHGTVGKLLVDDTLLTSAETALARLDAAIAGLGPIETRAGTVLGHADAVVGNLRGASANLRTASARLPSIAAHADAATADLPALVTETQVTADQLRRLIVQLRGLWILGGGGGAKAPATLPPSDVAP